MRSYRMSVVCLLVLSGLAIGCANTHRHIRKATFQDGRIHEFSVSADEGFNIAFQACTDLGFRVFEVEPATRTVRLSGKDGGRGYVNAAVFVAASSADACRISVVAQGPTEKSPRRDWTGRILREIQSASGEDP